jgi:hypothetical protein
MAKNTDFNNKLPKQIGNLVFYELNGQHIIRTSSGFTSEANKNDVKYQKSRNTAREFGNMCSLCKSIRVSLADMLPKANRKPVMTSFNSIMTKVVAHDLVSAHGERNLSDALQTENGRNVLNGYEFNPETKLSFNYRLDADIVTIFTDAINFPVSAGSIRFRTMVLAFDFETRISQLNMGQWQFFDKGTLQDAIGLSIPNVENQNGILFALLEAEFYDKDGDVTNALTDDRSKSVRIMAVR